MKVTKGEFLGFKGLQKISTQGLFSIKLDDHSVIHSFSGENGTGKSTLVSTLNPFIFPNGFSGKSIENFISFPGHKIVEFILDGRKYRSEILFVEKGKTVAKLFTKVGGLWDLVPGFESGKTSVYMDLLESLIGISQKTLSTVNFIGQNTNGIIDSSPKDRRDLIYPLMDNMVEYDNVINSFADLENNSKSELLKIEGSIKALQVSDDDLTFSESYKSEFDTLSEKIINTEKSITSISNEGKSVREKIATHDQIQATINEKIKMSEHIKSSDEHANFPDTIETNFSQDDITFMENQLSSISANNNIKIMEVARLNEELSGLLNNLSSITKQNKEFISEYGTEALSNPINFSKIISDINKSITSSENKIKEFNKDIININIKDTLISDRNVIEEAIHDLTNNNDQDNIKSLLSTRSELMDKLSIVKSDYTPINKIFNVLISNHKISALADVIESDFNQVFGVGFGDASSQISHANSIDKSISDISSRIDKENSRINSIQSYKKSLIDKNKQIHNLIISNDNSKELLTAEEETLRNLNNSLSLNLEKSRISGIIGIYKNNEIEISKIKDRIPALQGTINSTKVEDTKLIEEKILLAKMDLPKIKANIGRSQFVGIMDDVSKLKSDPGFRSDLDTLKKSMNDIELHYKEMVQSLKVLNIELNKIAILDNRHREISSRLSRTNVLIDDRDELLINIKSYNKLKLYGKNIKETILSRFMINITDLANEYLASDSLSSIKIRLSIQQKGQNFNIFASQDGIDTPQEINTLSGAEGSTVNRALATAIAFSNKDSLYKLYAFDETDGSLSDSNKQAFVENIKNISINDKVEQLFIISQDSEISTYLESNNIVLEATC